MEPPDQNLRPEQKILSSEEAMVDLRKRDRAALVRLRGKGAQTVGFLFPSYFLLQKDKFAKMNIIFDRKIAVPQKVSLLFFFSPNHLKVEEQRDNRVHCVTIMHLLKQVFVLQY